MNFRNLISAVVATCLTAIPTLAEPAEDNVKLMPLSMGSLIDFGQVVKGKWNESVQDANYIQRTSVWVTQEIHVSDRLQVRAGVGGMFWYDIENPPPGEANVRPFVTSTKFGPGISRADMEYRFGDVTKPVATLQAGFFPYKYNADAANLGEYLLRSGAYPGYLSSGGWNLMGNGYMMQGVRVNVPMFGGKLQHEFLLPVERDLPPTGDISPTYIVTAFPARGVEVGGGVSCHHCLAVKPSVTSPKVRYGENATNFGNGSGIIRENPNFVDSLPATDLTGARVDNGLGSTLNPRYIYDTTSFYTFQGVKLMARASFDPKAYVTMDMLGPQDLKVFGEIALLGVKDYDFYYEKKTERMPVMFGFNAPTFRFLDVLSFQMEYYNSPFPNSIENAYRYQMPTLPFVNSGPSGTISEQDPNLFKRDLDEVTKDNWKWSLLAKKTVVRGLTIYAQAANDNQRLVNWKAEQSYAPVTNIEWKDWYYMMRLEMGI
jgi:hypothetical protein